MRMLRFDDDDTKQESDDRDKYCDMRRAPADSSLCIVFI